MNLSSTQVYAGATVLALFLASFVLVTDVFADTQDLRDRGTTGRTVDLTPAPAPAPAPTPAPTPTPPPASGGITSTTVGDVDTGNNTGGNVTTGDESVDVHEVNVGPTNPPPQPATPSTGSGQETPTPPTPSCDGRTRGCDTSGRTR